MHKPRKLAVILHADIADSTGLVGRDEALAHERITETFNRLARTVECYGGAVHEIRGDALLAEFSRASDAVSGALAFQLTHSKHVEQISDDVIPRVRIGISLGEVIFADNTVTGTGVVLAQRAEQLAEPGGVSLTSAVHEAVPRRLPFTYVDLGKRSLKGFQDPIQVYSVKLESSEHVPPPEPIHVTPARANTRPFVIATIATFILVAAGLLLWTQPWEGNVEQASMARMAFPLPDRPSIAVLPFENLDRTADDDILVDGFTENIITALARIPDIFVIARNSSFTYKAQSVKAKDVAEQLGVRYVLKGSIRTSDRKIRITAQLIDAISARHIWADSYDRQIENIFALQDEITLNILRALQVALTEGVLERTKRETSSLEAYLKFWNAIALYRRFNRDDNARSRREAKLALQLDPQFIRAAVLVGWTHQMDGRFGWSASSAEAYAKGAEIAYQALRRAPEHPYVYALISNVHLTERDFTQAIDSGFKSIELAPSVSLYYANTAVACYYAGDFEESVALTKEAMRLHPFYPAWYLYRLGVAYRMLGRYQEALEALESFYARLPKPNILALTALAATYAMMGRMDEARARVDELLRLYPKTSLRQIEQLHYFQNPVHLRKIIDALRAAGLPE